MHFALPLPAEGAVRAEVTDPDGYAADNVRFAVLDTPPRPESSRSRAAGAASGDSFYVERALAAAEGPDGMRLERVTMDTVSANPAALENAAGILLFSASGLDRRASDAISRAVERRRGAPAGARTFAGPDARIARIAGRARCARRRRSTSSDDPLTFAPTDVQASGVSQPSAPRGASSARRASGARCAGPRRRRVDTLARFSNGAPALVEVTGARGHVLLLASDLANAWNDFALHPAFVPFVHDLVRYLAAGRRGGHGVPRGRVGGRRTATDPASSHRVDREAEAGRRIAVNVNLREADGPRLTPAAFAAAVPRGADAGHGPAEASQRNREGDQSLWRYGLMVMLVGLAAESLIGRRA